MKATVKSCSCGHCRYSRRAKIMRPLEERAARHRNKQLLRQGQELFAPAHNGERWG